MRMCCWYVLGGYVVSVVCTHVQQCSGAPLGGPQGEPHGGEGRPSRILL
jgi:hypothetical protein